MLRRFALALALAFACTAPAWAAAPSLQQAQNVRYCTAVATCTGTLGSNPTAGDYVVIAGNWSGTSTPTFSGCTYNGSSVTIGYNSGAVTVAPNVVWLVISAPIPIVSSITAGICTWNTAGVNVVAGIAEITGTNGTAAAYQSGTCSTSSCFASVNQNLLTPGDLGLSLTTAGSTLGSASCTNWTSVGGMCTGTSTASSNVTGGGAATYGGAAAYIDIEPTGGTSGGSTCGPYPYPCLFSPANEPIKAWCWLCLT